MSTMYVEEFLVRGRPPGSDQQMTYHVILGQPRPDVFGKPQPPDFSDAMSPEQAAALGYGLPAIVAELNAGLMEENRLLKAEVAALTVARDALTEEVDRLTQGGSTIASDQGL